jgi:hypothetical protein
VNATPEVEIGVVTTITVDAVWFSEKSRIAVCCAQQQERGVTLADALRAQ